jgi:ABC-type phosphate/phosphonate transport system substrate-binding protein
MSERRSRRVVFGLALSLAFAAFFFTGRAQAGAPKGKPDIKIGVVESMFRDIPPKGVEIVLQKFTDLIEMQTGYKVQIEVAGDALSLGKAVCDGKYQMGVFNGFEFAWARDKSPDLQPLLIAVSRERNVRAHLVVRNDDNIKDIKGLKGKCLAQPWRCREFARLFLERRCLANLNAQPNDVFDSIAETPSSEEALDLVVGKGADAAIVDSVSYTQFVADKKNAGKLKNLDVSDVFPPSVLAFNKDALPQKQIDNFKKGMLNANQTDKGKDMMKFCGMTAFEAIPEDYETLLQSVLKEFPAVAPTTVQTPESEPVKDPVEVKDK